MARLRNPTGTTKEVLKVVDSPKLKEENRKLKDELQKTKDQLDEIGRISSESKEKLTKAEMALTESRLKTVSADAHQQLVDRHNDVLKEYGKLRMDVMKGSPQNAQMKAAEIKEKIVEKEVIREVIRIKRALDMKKAAIISLISSVAGLLAGLIF